MLDLTPRGRDIVGAVGLLVIGFALGSVGEIRLTQQIAAAIFGGGVTLLVLAARRGRNGYDEREREQREEHERER